MNAVELKNVSKTFKQYSAVRNVSFSIKQGEVVSILGPNGAGKTTTILMMLGLLDSSEGEVALFGKHPKEQSIKKRIGAMLQEVSVLDGLTVEEVIDLFRSYYPEPLSKKELLELSMLEKETKRKTDKLSGGQKRRLNFALAMAGDPDLLFLDEPTVGMDTTSRRVFWEKIKRLSTEGKTVIFTTHYLQEADDMSDRIILFKKGSIAAEGTPAEIKSLLSKKSVSFISDDKKAAVSLRALPFTTAVYKKGDRYYAETEDTDGVLDFIFKHGIKAKEIMIDHGRLEEAFEQLLNENERGIENERISNAMQG
ncbi:ABC transporter ATP-binding protein [Metabacillus sp. RGM 3146]|uniref:ABC transporter ATP-binding protein n=1 Tax=Metabacillus sp. RGM 3146 TaxID=3401092 RepID=UPI003B9C45C7